LEISRQHWHNKAQKRDESYNCLTGRTSESRDLPMLQVLHSRLCTSVVDVVENARPSRTS